MLSSQNQTKNTLEAITLAMKWVLFLILTLRMRVPASHYETVNDTEMTRMAVKVMMKAALVPRNVSCPLGSHQR